MTVGCEWAVEGRDSGDKSGRVEGRDSWDVSGRVDGR
jgi:hypothetical protein